SQQRQQECRQPKTTSKRTTRGDSFQPLDTRLVTNPTSTNTTRTALPILSHNRIHQPSPITITSQLVLQKHHHIRVVANRARLTQRTLSRCSTTLLRLVHLRTRNHHTTQRHRQPFQQSPHFRYLLLTIRDTVR